MAIYFQFFFPCSLATCSDESMCVNKRQLGLKELHFYCLSHNLSPIVLTPPCIFCLTYCLQLLSNSAEGLNILLSSIHHSFVQAELTATTTNKSQNTRMVIRYNMPPFMGLSFRTSPFAKDSGMMGSVIEGFPFMSFRGRCVSSDSVWLFSSYWVLTAAFASDSLVYISSNCFSAMINQFKKRLKRSA